MSKFCETNTWLAFLRLNIKSDCERLKNFDRLHKNHRQTPALSAQRKWDQTVLPQFFFSAQTKGALKLCALKSSNAMYTITLETYLVSIDRAGSYDIRSQNLRLKSYFDNTARCNRPHNCMWNGRRHLDTFRHSGTSHRHSHRRLLYKNM